MKTEYRETKRTAIIDDTVRYGKPIVMVHRGIPHEYPVRLQNLNTKIEGELYVDGEFISNWVQYI